MDQWSTEERNERKLLCSWRFTKKQKAMVTGASLCDSKRGQFGQQSSCLR